MSAGPWSSVFTALALCGLLLFTGCRKAPAPLPAHVDLAALAALHPGQAMVADLDHRIAGLAVQRAHLDGVPDPALPPATVIHPAPAVAALPSPPPPYLPAPPTEQVNLRDLDALRRVLTQQADRQLLRTERELRARYAAALAKTQARIADDADARQQKSAKAFLEQHPLYIPAENRDVRVDLARRAVANAEDGYADVQKRVEQAHQLYADRKQTAERRPKDKKAQQRLAEGERLVAQAGAQVGQAKRTLDDARQRAEYLQTQFERSLRQYQQELQTIAVEMKEAKARAREESDAARVKDVAARRLQLSREIEQRLAKETARLKDEVRYQPAPSPGPMVTFDGFPEGALRVEAPELARDAQRGEAQSRAERQHALAALEKTHADLLAERAAVLASITADTRAAAESLAAQHGYRLTAREGTEITRQMRAWLQQYWPAE